MATQKILNTPLQIFRSNIVSKYEIYLNNFNAEYDGDFIAFSEKNAVATDAALTVIVFAAMAYETFCFDYVTVVEQSKKRAKKILKKYTAIERIKEITKRYFSAEFPENSDAYIALKNVIKTRNKIIHAEPGVIEYDSKNGKITNDTRFWIGKQNVDNAYNSFDLMIEELKKIDTKLNEKRDFYLYKNNYFKDHRYSLLEK